MESSVRAAAPALLVGRGVDSRGGLEVPREPRLVPGPADHAGVDPANPHAQLSGEAGFGVATGAKHEVRMVLLDVGVDLARFELDGI